MMNRQSAYLSNLKLLERMAITIKYFGSIAEKIGLNQEHVDLQEIGSDLADVKVFCEGRYAIAELAYQISVNKKLVSSAILSDGDEIAFLPPFAGG